MQNTDDKNCKNNYTEGTFSVRFGVNVDEYDRCCKCQYLSYDYRTGLSVCKLFNEREIEE